MSRSSSSAALGSLAPAVAAAGPSAAAAAPPPATAPPPRDSTQGGALVTSSGGAAESEEEGWADVASYCRFLCAERIAPVPGMPSEPGAAAPADGGKSEAAGAGEGGGGEGGACEGAWVVMHELQRCGLAAISISPTSFVYLPPPLPNILCICPNFDLRVHVQPTSTSPAFPLQSL